MKQRVWWAALALCSCAVLAANEGDPLLDGDMQSSAGASPSSEIRGVLRARSQAVLASELPGRVVEIAYAEGESFKKNAVLVRFDCTAYQAQANASAAAVRAAREELQNKQQLAALNSVGRFEVALAQARQAQAQAESQVYQVQVQRCQIKAPYDGQVVSKRVQAHESVASGAPLLEIVDNRSLEVHLLVPSRWVGKLQPEQTFSFIPDETGQPFEAVIKRLGARIDEGSQTLLLIASVPANTQGLLAGMSGTAKFAAQP
ncbi:efflux RND transporter periplasmic adaptor subunit [Pseudomonas sp. 5P_3.1_Bac2]|uniref:efflux RND transporter periplasmic adaptor subunit n=1 Tax=Pseudomonas sp. 5P_3.1_Bac2 TaxID=2971617 RepID=UPI0021C7AFC7|nr:efflux RND transporter periplasmic adaptor subunit [Pseudomonas sp. 5P_3.1_Bac2]MCU1717252.1 efflux RND transporter periplasmic adaptor subunit [Pseudomonas sp. 5P_3.1_Bac2]